MLDFLINISCLKAHHRPIIGLGTVLVLCLVLSCRNHLHQDSNPKQIFVAVAFVPMFSLPKQTSLALVLVFCHA
jgi:uncharacterized membrane protein